MDEGDHERINHEPIDFAGEQAEMMRVREVFIWLLAFAGVNMASALVSPSEAKTFQSGDYGFFYFRSAILLVLVTCVIKSPLMAKGPCHEHGATPTQPDDFVPYFKVQNEKLSVILGGGGHWGCKGNWQASLVLGWVYNDSIYKLQDSDRSFSLELTSVTVRDIFDTITKMDGTYSWTYDSENKVFNLISNFRNPAGKYDVPSVLEKKISHFAASNVNIREAIYLLLEQAKADGIEGLTTTLRQRKDPFDLQSEQKGYITCVQTKFNYLFHNKTLRECLNAIVAADKPASWSACLFRDTILINGSESHSHASCFQGKSKTPNGKAPYDCCAHVSSRTLTDAQWDAEEKEDKATWEDISTWMKEVMSTSTTDQLTLPENTRK